MALGLYPDGASDVTRFDRMIDEIAGVGATDVALVVTWAQRDVTSTTIAAGRETIDDATLRHAIAHVKTRGMRAFVFPILTVRKLAPGQWRGTLKPRDKDTWWQAYERFILHYAAIAADESAETLLIGSELATTEAWMYRWYHLISGVERIYDGAIVYSGNWDHYPHVSFWRRLDAIGVTGYFHLTERKDASADELVRAWQTQRDTLLKHARKRGKPLWITEVGYTSVDGTARRPWDYHMKGRVDHDEQQRCYDAFIDAWNGVSGLQAVFFWNWYGKGGLDDRGYTPKGKPAERSLRRWYRGTPPRQ